MLAYAANTCPLGRSESPRALAFIVVGHALLLGALFMTKVDIDRTKSDPTDVIFVPSAPVPPPPKPVDDTRTPTRPTTSTIDKPPAIVPQPLADVADGLKVAEINPYVGKSIEPPFVPSITPKGVSVRLAARFATPDHLLRPPYPLSKLRGGEEASLRLRLTIDPRGRVTSVDPVGSVDAVFLAAARRHILKAWRYQPATENGVGVSSSVAITLSFRLNDA